MTIVLAEDHQLMIEGYSYLIDQIEGLDIVAKASDGYEALEAVEKYNPDLLILDLHMPRLNGLETLRHLAAKHRKTKVIIISMYGDSGIHKEAVKLGAKAYLLKHADQEEFIMAIKLVMKGKSYFSADLFKEQPRTQKVSRNENVIPLQSLTKREEEILKYVARGFTNNEIAGKLFLSPKTVDNHRTNLMRKLNVHNVTALVRYALSNGYDV